MLPVRLPWKMILWSPKINKEMGQSPISLFILQPVEALSGTEIFLKAALRAAFKNISGF